MRLTASVDFLEGVFSLFVYQSYDASFHRSFVHLSIISFYPSFVFLALVPENHVANHTTLGSSRTPVL
jgi:hypothetical protein